MDRFYGAEVSRVLRNFKDQVLKNLHADHSDAFEKRVHLGSDVLAVFAKQEDCSHHVLFAKADF